MATQGAYSVIDEGLVLHLDAANTKSFRGEPTVNLFTHPSTDTFPLRGYGTFVRVDVGDDVIWKYMFGGNVWTYHGYNWEVSAGTPYTLSFDVFISTDFSINSGYYFVFNMEGALSWAAYYDCSRKGTWQHFEVTSSPSYNNANVLMYPNTDTAYYSGYILYRNVQFEQKDHATPFVNGTRGTTVATGGGFADLSGYNNHGELVNGVSYNSNNCGSLVFDGIDDYINLGNTTYTQFSHITPWTINMWFNIVSYTNTYPGILRRGSSVGSGILLWFTNNVLRYKHNGSESGITIPNLIGQWINLILVYNGIGNVKAFINGVYNKDLLPMSGTEISDSLVLGTGDEPGNVKISTFHKYNRALSQSEITQIYNSTKTRYL